MQEQHTFGSGGYPGCESRAFCCKFLDWILQVKDFRDEQTSTNLLIYFPPDCGKIIFIRRREVI